jgi:hypothetical protein
VYGSDIRLEKRIGIGKGLLAGDMSQQLPEEQWIRAYFLGDLPESEEERIQERLFTDHDFFESLLMVEGELVDDYALDLISDPERSKLERGFLASPHQYRKVELVKTLDRYIENNKAVPSALRSSAPSLFTRLGSTFVNSTPPLAQNVELGSDQNRVKNASEKEREVRERMLREAQANRSLLQCLMANDWLALELLLQLNTVPQVPLTHLAVLVERDEGSLTVALSLLIDSGLVKKAAGKYTCSAFGCEILEKIKEVTSHD